MDKQGLDSVMTIHYCTVVYSDNTGMVISKIEPYILLMIHDATLWSVWVYILNGIIITGKVLRLSHKNIYVFAMFQDIFISFSWHKMWVADNQK